MVVFAGIQFDVSLWGLALGFFIGSILLADLLIVTIDKLVRPLLAKTKTQLDDFLFENLRGPLKFFFSIGGAYLGLDLVMPSVTFAGRNLQGLFFLALILAVGHATARVLNALMQWYAVEIGVMEKSRVGDVFPLVRRIATAAVYFATLVILLSELGVEIGPLIAGLGVAGLAVALALQDSMKNFFAGLYLIADKPIRTGDLIALDSDASSIKGVVEEIGWRATRIRAAANALHIVPNEKLASGVIVNYSKGKDTRSVAITVGVDYSQDMDQALEVLKAAAIRVAKASKFADDSVKPEVRLNDFGDSQVDLYVSLRVKNYADRFSLASDLRKEILRTFRKEKISIPFPVRTLHWEANAAKKVVKR